MEKPTDIIHVKDGVYKIDIPFEHEGKIREYYAFMDIQGGAPAIVTVTGDPSAHMTSNHVSEFRKFKRYDFWYSFSHGIEFALRGTPEYEALEALWKLSTHAEPLKS